MRSRAPTTSPPRNGARRSPKGASFWTSSPARPARRTACGGRPTGVRWVTRSPLPAMRRGQHGSIGALWRSIRGRRRGAVSPICPGCRSPSESMRSFDPGRAREGRIGKPWTCCANPARSAPRTVLPRRWTASGFGLPKRRGGERRKARHPTKPPSRTSRWPWKGAPGRASAPSPKAGPFFSTSRRRAARGAARSSTNCRSRSGARESI